MDSEREVAGTDLDYRTLELMLGSPQSTSAEVQSAGERDVYRWPCGCVAKHESNRTYCVVDWCMFHRDTLLPKT